MPRLIRLRIPLWPWRYARAVRSEDDTMRSLIRHLRSSMALRSTAALLWLAACATTGTDASRGVTASGSAEIYTVLLAPPIPAWPEQPAVAREDDLALAGQGY